MNVRIFWVRAMKCMCAQTRPRFILSSEGVFGGMEFEPMLTPREKSPLPENVPRGGANPRRYGQRAQALPTELFQSPKKKLMWILKKKSKCLHDPYVTLTGLLCSHLPNTISPCKSFGSFMPFHNRMITQVPAFLWLCDREWKPRSFQTSIKL